MHEPDKYVPVVQLEADVHGLHVVVDVAVQVPVRYWPLAQEVGHVWQAALLVESW